MASRENTKLVPMPMPAHIKTIKKFNVIDCNTGNILGYVLRWGIQGLPVEWSAYALRGYSDPHIQFFGDFKTRREAVSEVWIMSVER